MEEDGTYTLVLAERPSLAQEASHLQVPCISVASCTAGAPCEVVRLATTSLLLLEWGPPSHHLQVSSLSRQVANQQGLLDNIGGANEAQLGEFLKACAQEINPSGSVQVLQRTPFRDERGRVSGAVLRRRGDLLQLLYAPLCSFAAPVRGRACQG